MSSRASRRKGKRPQYTSPWSEYVWDERGFWYKSRTGPSGELEYQYAYPETSQAVPLPDSDQPATTESNQSSTTSNDCPTRASLSYPTSNQASQAYLDDTRYCGSVGDFGPLEIVTKQFATTSITKEQSYSTTATSTSDSIQAKPNSQRATIPYNSYQIINDGNRFFKVGRVFRCLWAEPAGSNAREFLFATPSTGGEKIFSKDRHFVVVREQRGSCTCVAINTYGRQGTTKPGVAAGDHAAVYDNKKFSKPTLARGERLSRDAFPIIVEVTGENIDPMSRINFGRVYTVEHNVKVIKIGRIPNEHLDRLKKSFVQCFLGETTAAQEPVQAKPNYGPATNLAFSSGTSHGELSGGYNAGERTMPGYNLAPGYTSGFSLPNIYSQPSYTESLAGYTAATPFAQTYNVAPANSRQLQLQPQPQPQPQSLNPNSGYYPEVPFGSSSGPECWPQYEPY